MLIDLKFEHHTQKAATLPQFILRMGRYGIFAFALIAFALGIGILGYHFLGRPNMIDSFHMSSMSLTGMGPVAEMTTKGAKLFSSFYALYSGAAFFSITAVFFAPVIHRLLHILQVEKGDEDK